ncbi:MAG: chemotaxis protein CheW [Sulfobacillus sp.]
MTKSPRLGTAANRTTRGQGRAGSRRGQPPGPEVASVLKARAKQLAQPLERAQPMRQPINLLVFTLNGERYGIDMAYVAEVSRPSGVTAVPCTPSFFLGLTSYRGRALPLVDLGVLLGVCAQASEFGDQTAVVVQVGGVGFGFLTDDAPTVIQVDAHGWTQSAPAAGSSQAGFVRTLTDLMVGVVDLDALWRSGRMLVDQAS